MTATGTTVLESRARKVARLRAALAAQIEALAAWAAGQEERQERLEILTVACEEGR